MGTHWGSSYSRGSEDEAQSLVLGPENLVRSIMPVILAATRNVLLLLSAAMLPIEGLRLDCCCAARRVATPRSLGVPAARCCCHFRGRTSPDLQQPCCARLKSSTRRSSGLDRSCCQCARAPIRIASAEYVRTWAPTVTWQALCIACPIASELSRGSQWLQWYGGGPPRAGPVLDRCVAFHCLII